MANEIKSLLDSIIDNTDNSYPERLGGHPIGDPKGPSGPLPQTYDAGRFREKLSLYVLHDIVAAMMHDETKDLDNMIDSSIMKHINRDYNGTCYGYLCGARDRLKSPLFSDIVQELDDKTEEVSKEVSATKDDDVVNCEVDIKDILKRVNNYEEFRNKIKDVVTDKVVDDVAKVIATKNDAPVFDNVDKSLEKQTADKFEEEKATQESVILRLCGAIVTESAANHEMISTEEGLNMAIVEYCLDQMDFLCKAVPKQTMYDRYRI